MVKFTAELKDGVHLVSLGLSRRNMEMLILGKPIIVEGDKVGIPKTQIMIFGGETEESMTKDLVDQGLITDDTKIHSNKKG